MTLLLTYVALALGVSFLCSILEAVLLSVTPSYAATLRDTKPVVGDRLQRFKSDIDRPLAAILSLNTIAHTVGAAGAGAQAARVFGDGYVGVISAVLTLLILFLSEIIPKTLGAVYWRQLAPLVTRILQPLIWSMWPLVKMSAWTRRLLVRGDDVQVISREELAAMARLGHEEGVIGEGESRVLESLFQFRSLRARDIMTPRTVVYRLPEETLVGEVIAEPEEIRFSRIPIYHDANDQITGYVLKDDLLLRGAKDEDELPLSALRRKITVVPASLELPRLFERLLGESEHIAEVVDEYGGMVGVVTMEDLVETLLGMEIVDEVDSVENMQELAREKWRVRAKRLGLSDEEIAAADQS